MRVTFVFLISLVSYTSLFGQSDSLSLGHKNKFSIVPYGIRVGIDILELGLTLADEDVERYGINADIDIYKFLVQFDAGYARRARVNDLIEYRSRGYYYRIGIDYNLMFFDDDKSTIFTGLRYGRSFSYDDELKYVLSDSTYGAAGVEAENTNASANWLEANIGVKAKIWRNFYMGFIGRFKFRLRANTAELSSFDIPGFGRTDNTNIVAFNYYIWYRIPFRENDLLRTRKNKR